MGRVIQSALTADDTRTIHILGELGRGGFGVVLHAELCGLGDFRKEVAIKLLHGKAGDMLARCLRDEARMLGLIRHPGVVQVDGLMQIDGRWAVVMEYVDGADLGVLIEGGPMPDRVALEIASEISRVLTSAWETLGPDGQPLHLIHRDLKPFNIRVTPTGMVKVLDFGTARAQFSTRELNTTLVAGTPKYMSPERLAREDGPEGDVYALGAVLYEMLCRDAVGCTTAYPSTHQVHLAMAMARLNERRPDLGLDVVRLITEMLDGDPAARPRPTEIEDRCDTLASTMSGEGLKRWAAHRVPELRRKPLPLSSFELEPNPLQKYLATPRPSTQTPDEVLSSRQDIPDPLANETTRLMPPRIRVPSPPPRSRALWVGLGLLMGMAAVFTAMAARSPWLNERPRVTEETRVVVTSPQPALPVTSALCAPEAADPDPALMAPPAARCEPTRAEPGRDTSSGAPRGAGGRTRQSGGRTAPATASTADQSIFTGR